MSGPDYCNSFAAKLFGELLKKICLRRLFSSVCAHGVWLVSVLIASVLFILSFVHMQIIVIIIFSIFYFVHIFISIVSIGLFSCFIRLICLNMLVQSEKFFFNHNILDNF